jgi:hypothetical protein
MKTLREYLDQEWSENGGHLTKKTILNKACDFIGSYMDYADIEGQYLAVYSFWEHNVDDIIVVENKSWVGYEIRLESTKSEWLRNNYNKDSVRLICPQWAMNLTIKNSLHARNLFSKYLKLV